MPAAGCTFDTWLMWLMWSLRPLRPLRHLVLCGAAMLLWAPAPGNAQATLAPEPVHLHTTARGDTLIGLGQRFLVDPSQWPELARANHLAQPNRLSTGVVLVIPLRLMVVEPVPGVVVAVSGDVSLLGKAGTVGSAAGTPLLAGQPVPEGSELRTGVGSATVRLVDGTVLRLRAGSSVQIDASSRVPRTGSVRSGVVLQQGQIEVQAQPASAGQPGFRVNTPQGVLGVRGTEFRVHAEAASATTRSEVLEGAVAATGTRAQPAQAAGVAGVAGVAPSAQRVGAGFGVVVDRTGSVSPPVALLPAPNLAQLPALQERALVRFTLPALAGATAYRGQVARDARFDQLLADLQSESTELRIADLPDGDYVLRVRGVDTNGLQGFNADHAFRLKARPEPPLPQTPAPRAVIAGDRVALAWTANPDASSYRVQLSRSNDFTAPLLDLRGQTAGTLPLADLAPGVYYWRLASERSSTDQGPFGAVFQFELRAIPPLPKAPGAAQVGVDDDNLRLAWEGAPGQTFEVQLARELAFATVLVQRTVTTPSLALGLPGSGRFYLRVRARDADGFVGPYGSAQQIDIPNCLRAASGACVKAEGASILIGP